jgi:lipopolysaccharide/colanic/teichoic acid biosynthesis glycosyltransferase
MQLSSRALESSAVSAPDFPVSVRPSVFVVAANRGTRIESPTASDWSLSDSKRLIDLSFALLVLAVFGIPMLVIALCVRLSSPGPAFFSQHRVGRHGRLFRIYKFRSMIFDADQSGPIHTTEGDCRITGMGRLLRKFKLDELPQFYNILRGEMSLVGPRPKLPQHEAIVNMPYRPGITGAATLTFRREEEILSRVHPIQIDHFYDRHIRPLKARIDVRYMCRATIWSDMRLIGATFITCLTPARAPAVFRSASTRVLVFPPPPAQKGSIAKSIEVAN